MDLLTAEENTCYLHWPVKSRAWSCQEVDCEACHHWPLPLVQLFSFPPHLSPSSPAGIPRALHVLGSLPFPGGEDRPLLSQRPPPSEAPPSSCRLLPAFKHGLLQDMEADLSPPLVLFMEKLPSWGQREQVPLGTPPASPLHPAQPALCPALSAGLKCSWSPATVFR